VIPTTSVSRPQLKSNPQGDRVLGSNSRGKKLEVEEHRRNAKLPKNKNYLESNKKPRNLTRKLYERVSKTCSWWYSKFTPSGYIWKPKSGTGNVNPNLIEIVLFIVDSGCSKHMTRNLKLLINFVEKFLGTVKFGNDQIAPILRYVDLVQEAVTIKRVYYVKGINHNLYSVGQFCDADLEVAFRKSTCFIRDLKENDLLTARAEGNTVGQIRNQIRCYNCMGTDSAPVYDSDGSAEVHENYDENCDDNEIFNMFTQEEQYTELLEPIPESHQVPQNDNDIISEDTSVKQDLNKQLSKEKSTVSFLLEEKKNLKSDFKTREDELLDKQIQFEKKIKELNNILLKMGQSIQTIHTLSPKPDSFYHTEQKMALGYQNPFYLKQAQKKQQSLYDENVLLEKHDHPVVHDSEETLQLTQESREKMKQLNKEIKPANYTKINHFSRVFVPQTALSREELYFSNNSKTSNVSKSILIPNEDFSDDTTPSVAHKFSNEVKSTIVTLQRVVKQRMTIETHNWSSSAHHELHKIVREEIFPIVNQVDARVQNFEIQF
nr:integrase, catalytic region, zinc finger, CCHC-type, peptidase aspartic, catalytic [Tanacetum cinerariifolium]